MAHFKDFQALPIVRNRMWKTLGVPLHRTTGSLLTVQISVNKTTTILYLSFLLLLVQMSTTTTSISPGTTYYRPPTKLPEGYVFRQECVCHSVHRRVSYDHYPWCLDITWQGYISPRTARSLTDIWWSRWETCSNLFTWGPPPGSDIR